MISECCSVPGLIYVYILQAYFWTKTRKNRPKYIAMRGINGDVVGHLVLHDVVVAKNVDKAEKEILDITGLKRYVAKLSSDREREWFRRHLRKYIQMYLPDSPFEVTTTNRYTITNHEAAICARQFIKKGQGFQVGQNLQTIRSAQLSSAQTQLHKTGPCER